MHGHSNKNRQGFYIKLSVETCRIISNSGVITELPCAMQE